MRKLILVLFVALLAPSICAQNVRYSTDIPSISSSTTVPYLVANVPPNSLTLSVCNSPANATPCTNYATTYTSSGAACSNGAQDTPDPQPSACQSTSDARGNIGFWAPPGKYDYTVCVQNTTTCYGPFTVTLGATTLTGATGQLVGDIPRWNVNGDNTWDPVGYPQLYDGVFACSTNVSCAVGMAAATAPTGCCSESIAGQNPTASAPFLTTTYSAAATGSTSTVIGIQHAENGNTGDWFVRGFWRMTHKLSITAVANNRYYWGLGVWNNGSSLGSNGTNVLGTTVFASDTPNHTFIGWRWSASTDVNFKAVIIQAGVSATTTVIDTGVAGDSNLHSFDVTLDSGNTTFTFYIDGKNVGNTPASGITFSPSSAGDALATLFFTGDNKNTNTAVSTTFANMFIAMRQ